MRAVANPPNPYQGSETEWLGPPPAVRVEVFEEEVRSVLTRNESPDIGFEWSLNPYRGCLHACAYCYARPQHEYLGFGAGTDFETKIVVKINAPERLRAELARPAWKGDLIAFSGDTDCYQPYEASYRLTRRCLETCAEFRNPVGLITKSPLVRRDLDVLQDLARHGAVQVAISIAFSDDAVQKAVEPGAPSPRLRFEAIRALAAADIPVSVLFAPVIPGLNDDQIPAVLEAAAGAGARSAGMILLRLPGSVKDVFLPRIRTAFPERAARIEARLRESRDGGLNDSRFHHRFQGTGNYWQAIADLFALHRSRLGLDAPLKAPSPSPFLRPGPEQLRLF